MKNIWIAVILGILTFPLLTRHGRAEETAGLKEEIRQVEALREDINLLNLLNGLNLTDEQSRRIMDLATEARTIKQGGLEENIPLLNEFKETLLALKEGIMDKNWRPDPEIEKKAGQLNHRLKEQREKTFARLQALGVEARGILTPGQLAIVEDYKPCLIPPKDLKSPIKAGQAFDVAPAEKFLSRARFIPSERYDKTKEALVEEFLDRLEKHLGPLPDRTAKREEVLKAIEAARAMTDEEFALEKEDMANKLAPKPEGQDHPQKGQGPTFGIHHKGLDKVGRLLLNERIIPILEKRLALSRDFTPGKGTDPGSLPAVSESCPSKKD
ncbi:MAG: hypothetical protein ACK4WF_06025 [Candidatus Brocadiales bacterium]